MAYKFVVAHRMDQNNVGDMASNPLQYFLPSDQYQVVDVADIGRLSYDESLPMIVGGGGLIGNAFMGDFFTDFLRSSDKAAIEHLWSNSWIVHNLKNKEINEEFQKKFQSLIGETLEKINEIVGPRFVWGAGHNGEGDAQFENIRWPKSFSKYKLIGIRDFHEKSRFPWVPCASCMHPALNEKYPIKNDVIWFEHKKQLIKDFGTDPIPRFINSGNNIEQTIELLGSANIILTNSYHGAYWGTLLKKRVIIVGGAWSSKFKWLKHQLVICDKKEDWKEALDRSIVYDDSLEECRSITEKWWIRIREQV